MPVQGIIVICCQNKCFDLSIILCKSLHVSNESVMDELPLIARYSRVNSETEAARLGWPRTRSVHYCSVSALWGSSSAIW